MVNYYATTETGPIAWECLLSPGLFHVLLPDVWVESLRDELLVTRLRPGAWPLLRYRTGDAGRVVEAACPCGFDGPSLTGFTGRRACLFSRPDGTAVDAWQLAWLFKQHPLRSFSLVQAGPNASGSSSIPPRRPRRRSWPRCSRRRCGAWAGPHPGSRRAGRPLARPGAKPEPFRCELALSARPGTFLDNF